jgi:hypothetical protein
MSALTALPTFIITVPSNDPSNIGGSNQNFEVQMPYDLAVNGLWQVSGLQVDYQPTNANDPLYVYTNLIISQIVGNFSVPLLLNLPGVPVAGQATLYRQPEPQAWCQVSPQSVQSIQFTILDGLGNAAALGASPTIITLLFSRVN